MDLIRKSWLEQEPPPNYVAGLGRGATGFTTRSDIGPMRSGDDDDKADYSESNYDEFEGYGGTLNNTAAAYEQDDKEADDVWDAIEEKMDERRRHIKEKKMREEVEKQNKERPKLQAQFADLKRDLNQVSYEEWDAIPDIGDQTARFRKKVKTTPGGFVPVPDSLLEGAKLENEHFNTVDTNLDNFETPIEPGQQGGTTELSQRAVGEGRKLLLNMNLEKMSSSVTGQTTVDPKNYLTGLSSVKISSDAEIGDIKKARLLLQSVRTTNPKHAPGWIASARLEEVAGKLQEARKLIVQATQVCPDSDDVWIECARLHPPENAKAILARALKTVTQSVKLWIYAANLETDPKLKRRVLRKALEFVPSSVKLWKAAIEQEKEDDAKVLLQRAVECVPHSVEMWLALANLETYQNAKKVLNKARQTLPAETQIWITAAKLEEANGETERVYKVIQSAIAFLQKHIKIDRKEWLEEAYKAEHSNSLHTCQAIVKETIGYDVDPDDRKRIYREDAQNSIQNRHIVTARAIYAHALTQLPTSKALWLESAKLERDHGTPEQYIHILEKAVQACPQAEILWLMLAKDYWQRKDAEKARQVLHDAFAANPDSEQIWLAAVKLEMENNQPDRARRLLDRAREQTPTDRVYMKSALLEREQGQSAQEAAILDDALKRFPQSPKLWIMRAQALERQDQPDQAREHYQRGIKNCPHFIPLWLCAARLEERYTPAKARPLLEKARQQNPKNDLLWHATVAIERRANNPKVAQALLAKGLQECPNSGLLWSDAIQLEPTQQKKNKSVEALKRCDNDPFVILAVANLFWADKKLDRAKTWLNRAVTVNPDFGDAWAYLYRFHLLHGTPQEQEQIRNACVQANPHHGERWIEVSKKIGNSTLSTQDILIHVATNLPLPK